MPVSIGVSGAPSLIRLTSIRCQLPDRPDYPGERTLPTTKALSVPTTFAQRDRPEIDKSLNND